MKNVFLIVIVAAMWAVDGAAEAAPVLVTVDGAPVFFERIQPKVVNGVVLVPLRGVFEAMGATVHYDSASRKVMVQKENRKVILPIGANTASVNGLIVPLASRAQVIYGRTMVPLRFIANALGAYVQWNGDMVIILTRKAEARSSFSQPIKNQKG